MKIKIFLTILTFSKLNFLNAAESKKLKETNELKKYIESLNLRKFVAVDSNLSCLPKTLTSLISQYTFCSQDTVTKATKDLFIAIDKNDLTDVMHAIENDANVNSTNLNNNTPLTEIINGKDIYEANSKINIFQLLILAGADVNKTIKYDDDEYTPLMLASRYYWQEDIIKILIENGADVKAKNTNNLTALHCTISSSYPNNIIKKLMKAGADIEAKDCKGNTPLMSSVEFGNVQVINSLIEAGADINTTNNWGYTPLTIALNYGQTEIIRVLLKKMKKIQS